MDMAVAEKQYTTISGVPIDPLYGPGQLRDFDVARDLAVPGEFPYTRGIHETCIAGASGPCGSSPASPRPRRPTAAITTCWSRAKPGLSVAFDLPTLMGYDADHALAEGEVGKCGASISSLEDMEILFRGIPLATSPSP